MKPQRLTDAKCVNSVRGVACAHSVLSHALPEEAMMGSFDLRDPQPCMVCDCPDFRAFA